MDYITHLLSPDQSNHPQYTWPQYVPVCAAENLLYYYSWLAVNIGWLSHRKITSSHLLLEEIQIIMLRTLIPSHHAHVVTLRRSGHPGRRGEGNPGADIQ